ncbi:MAG: HlyD family secretion protein [Burkholderiales bacterium]|nr:HlyD family secretion protein [Burkholderiales bacterium]
MIERLKTVKQSLADRPQIRRAFFVVIVLAVLGLAGRVVYHRMTHIDVTDARIASEMISLASRSPGWLTARPVKEGDIVHRDQVLAEIYAQNASLAASAQEAGLQSAQAEVMRLDQLMLETRASTLAAVQEAKSQLAAVQVAIEQARLNEAKTQADYLRDRDLVDRQFVSEQRVQQSETVYKIAQGERERLTSEASAAQARVAKAQAAAGLDSLATQAQRARADAQGLRAKLGLSRLDLQDLRLVSPVNGVVDRSFANMGDYLAAGQRVLMMHDPEAIWVEANIKETDLASIRLGQSAEITVDAYPKRVFEARVSLIGNSATSAFALLPNPNPSGNFTKITQRVPIRLAIRQDGLLLKPGMMVEVSLDTRQR